MYLANVTVNRCVSVVHDIGLNCELSENLDRGSGCSDTYTNVNAVAYLEYSSPCKPEWEPCGTDILTGEKTPDVFRGPDRVLLPVIAILPPPMPPLFCLTGREKRQRVINLFATPEAVFQICHFVVVYSKPL